MFVCSAFIPMSLGINTRITDTREQPSTFSRGKTPYVGGKEEGKTYIMTSWYEQAKLLAPDGGPYGYFGCSVSLDGDTALIGAFNEDGNVLYSGSAYVFKRDGTSWEWEAKLMASDGATDDDFGYSVSLDGDTALIGAYGDDNNMGSAYLFKYDGAVWNEEAKLLASDGATDDDFGYSVSLDGDTALIGAFCDDPHGDRSGSAYVFKRNGTNWTEEAKLIASDGTERDMFGYSVSLDGDTALIGAHKDNDSGTNSGSAYVFKRNETGWIQQAKLLATDGASHDKFGKSVSIDGDTALIGAYGDNSHRGSAYLFKYDGTNWTQQAKLLPASGESYFWLGRSVFLNGDTALIGAMRSYGKGDDQVGSAYLFKYDGAVWNEEAKLLASDGANQDAFGYSVSLDGDTALIGALWNDDIGRESGSAYVFKKLDGNAPPHAPDIDGQISGSAGTEYRYTFNAVDPNKDDVKYYIDWGDGGSQTTTFRPSGTDVKVKHTWSKQGTYTLKAKANDIHGLVGPEGTLTVTMPRNRATYNSLFLSFLEQFPILQKLLLL